MLWCLCINSFPHCSSLYLSVSFWLLELTFSAIKPSHNLTVFHILCLYLLALTEIWLSAKSITPITASSLSCIPPPLVLGDRDYIDSLLHVVSGSLLLHPHVKSICFFERYSIWLCLFLQLLSFILLFHQVYYNSLSFTEECNTEHEWVLCTLNSTIILLDYHEQMDCISKLYNTIQIPVFQY